MTDYDHEAALEEQVNENIDSLTELKNLRNKSNTEEFEKTRSRREMTVRRTIENLKESCEAEQLSELVGKCKDAVESSFKIPKLTANEKQKVITPLLSKKSKKYFSDSVGLRPCFSGFLKLLICSIWVMTLFLFLEWKIGSKKRNQSC